MGGAFELGTSTLTTKLRHHAVPTSLFALVGRALHLAVIAGRKDIVEWLLDHGAEPSLRLRTRLGNTPEQLARKYGPYFDIEEALSRAEERAQALRGSEEPLGNAPLPTQTLIASRGV